MTLISKMSFCFRPAQGTLKNESQLKHQSLNILVPGQDPDEAFNKKLMHIPTVMRQDIVVRLLCLAFTNAADWNWARRSMILAQEYGFNEEDDFLKEGKVLKVDNLTEDLIEAHIEIAKLKEESARNIAKLKTDHAKEMAKKDEEIAQKDEEIKDLLAENAKLRADRSTPLPA